MLLFALFYASTLLSFLNSENTSEATRKLILKLPVLCFPLLFTSIRKTDARTRLYMAVAFLYAVYLPAVVSVYNYLINKTLFDQLILESKPLPIEFGYGIYHIQFSVILAASVLLGCFLLLQRKRYNSQKSTIRLIAILTILNFVFLHILSARTGLLALYAGLTVLALYEGRKLPLKMKLFGLLAGMLLPVCLILLSSSLQNRLKNTAEDIKVVWKGADANDYSFAMRVQAWQNAGAVIAAHPLTGVGLGDADSVLYEHFGTFNPDITPSNRKNPHFQFLETAVQSGLISALLFLGIIVLMLSGAFASPLPIAMALMFLIASCFESILERQSSVIAFSMLLAYAAQFPEKPFNSETSDADKLSA